MSASQLIERIKDLPQRSFVPDGNSVADRFLDPSTAKFIDFVYASGDLRMAEELEWPMVYRLRPDVFVVYLPIVLLKMVRHPHSTFTASMVSSLRDTFCVLPDKRKEFLSYVSDPEVQLLLEVVLFIKSRRPSWRSVTRRRLTELCKSLLCLRDELA